MLGDGRGGGFGLPFPASAEMAADAEEKIVLRAIRNIRHIVFGTSDTFCRPEIRNFDHI